jgi:hypothetical protein
MSDKPWCCFVGCDKDAEFDLGAPLTKADYNAFDTDAHHEWMRQFEDCTQSCAEHVAMLMEDHYVVEPIETSARTKYTKGES